MAYITFLYLLILFLLIIRKHGLDISACIVGVYAVSSFVSILLLRNDFFKDSYSPTLLPSLVYCTMITLVVLPFYNFNSNKRRLFFKMNPKMFDGMSWMFIFGFVFSLVLFWQDLVARIVLGEVIGELRGEEVETAQAGLSGGMQIISSIVNIINSMSSISLILFFYSIAFLKKHWLFNLALFISSMGSIIMGVIGIDRSKAMYWVMNLFFIFILMKPYLSKKLRAVSVLLMSIVLAAVTSYLILVTASRFKNDAIESVFSYMGQSYLNFCWYWDNWDAPIFNMGFFTPILSHFVIDWGYPTPAVLYGNWLEMRTGVFVNVFYTFMGTVMIYLGKSAVIPFCIIYTAIVSKKINKRNGTISLQSLIPLFIFSIVVYNGLISYSFVDYVKAIAAWIFIILCSLKLGKTEEVLLPKNIIH